VCEEPGTVKIGHSRGVVIGKRVNVSRGSHVWLARGVAVLGGVSIGEGTAVGVGSVVTPSLPNNVVAAGAPARVVPATSPGNGRT